jgi:hypothetical protein
VLLPSAIQVYLKTFAGRATDTMLRDRSIATQVLQLAARARTNCCLNTGEMKVSVPEFRIVKHAVRSAACQLLAWINNDWLNQFSSNQFAEYLVVLQVLRRGDSAVSSVVVLPHRTL